MTSKLINYFDFIDWPLVVAVVALSLFGLVTMNSFAPENIFFDKQVLWIVISLILFFVSTVIDYRFLRRSIPVITIFGITILTLLFIFFFGEIVKGSQSRFDIGLFSVQPSEFAKLVLIIVLAKYFTRRHIEIANIKHILISGAYSVSFFLLVFLQPDLGSAIIIGTIWLGVILVAGISKKHLMMLVILGAVVSGLMWGFVLADYQKERIISFINPLADIRGAGYNALQSTIAIGSGQLTGKGIGYGTQSKLQFLPEYETDFIFAAFAEEWGFFGVLLMFGLFGIVIWRVLDAAIRGATNFEFLFGVGVAILFISQFIVHVGMNIGLLPVTGTTIPFMSYGGSHLIVEFLSLGMLMGMRRYARAVHKSDENKEFFGDLSYIE